MKKLLTAVVFLLISTALFAQSNDSKVNQTGAEQKATVDQTGNLNVSTVDQYAEASSYGPGKQTATVTQVGTSNLADVDQNQTGGGGKTENTALVDQNGTNNKAYQTENAPSSNSGQHVTAIQDGIDNLSTQTINGGYTDNFLVDQKGTANTATQTGTGVTHNTAKIYQDGTDNTATQTLAGSNNGYYGGIYAGERILIDQFGERNIATQVFTGYGSSHGNSADIQQIGDDNTATQNGDGRNIYADFVQDGNDNNASSIQTGEAHKYLLIKSVIKIKLLFGKIMKVILLMSIKTVILTKHL